MRAAVRPGQIAVTELPHVGGPGGLDPHKDVVFGHEFSAELVAHGPQTGRTLPLGTTVCAVPLVFGPESVGYSQRFPDDAIAQIARLQEKSGGFGTYLLMGHEGADTAQTRRSYELFARYVAPHFQGSAATLTGSRDWAAANRGTFIGEAGAAVMSAMQRHEEEKKA
ncbi:hypothetical protein ACIBG8_10815 [Nonomuraea sp. NPDC050556]|uniref:hypothetical protein n=1 Tax=Nonomuraea sp. NPDC050556 TaxID=3364369 RepID=UPI0037AEC0CD